MQAKAQEPIPALDMSFIHSLVWAIESAKGGCFGKPWDSARKKIYFNNIKDICQDAILITPQKVFIVNLSWVRALMFSQQQKQCRQIQ